MLRRHLLSAALGLGLILVGIGCAIAMPKLLGGATGASPSAGDLVALVGPDPTATGTISFAFPAGGRRGARQILRAGLCSQRSGSAVIGRSTTICPLHSVAPGLHRGVDPGDAGLGMPETSLSPDDGDNPSKRDRAKGVPSRSKDQDKRSPRKDDGLGSPVEPDHPGNGPSPNPSAPPPPGKVPTPSLPGDAGLGKAGKRQKGSAGLDCKDEKHEDEKHESEGKSKGKNSEHI